MARSSTTISVISSGLLGDAVDCPAMAAKVAGMGVGPVEVGHQADLTSFCETGLDLVQLQRRRVRARAVTSSMLSITPLVAAPVGFLAALLGCLISLRRLAAGKARQKPEDSAFFLRLQRAHGNLAEHGPLMLVLLLVAELAGSPRELLIVGGVAVVASRVFHAVGLVGWKRRPNPLQFVGAGATYLVEAGLAGLALACSWP